MEGSGFGGGCLKLPQILGLHRLMSHSHKVIEFYLYPELQYRKEPNRRGFYYDASLYEEKILGELSLGTTQTTSLVLNSLISNV